MEENLPSAVPPAINALYNSIFSDFRVQDAKIIISYVANALSQTSLAHPNPLLSKARVSSAEARLCGMLISARPKLPPSTENPENDARIRHNGWLRAARV